MQLFGSRSVGLSLSPARPLRPSPGTDGRRRRTAPRLSPGAPPATRGRRGAGPGQGRAPRAGIPVGPAPALAADEGALAGSWRSAGLGSRPGAQSGCAQAWRVGARRAPAILASPPLRPHANQHPLPPSLAACIQSGGCVARKVQFGPHPPDLENRVLASNLKKRRLGKNHGPKGARSPNAVSGPRSANKGGISHVQDLLDHRGVLETVEACTLKLRSNNMASEKDDGT